MTTPKKYQPSNGEEGLRFMTRFCDRCANNSYDEATQNPGCIILARTMVYDVNEPQYPPEWQGDYTNAVCTAFKERK